MSEIEKSHNVDDIMRKVDRESNTRVFTGWRKIAIRALLIAYAVMILMFMLVLDTDNYVKFPVFIGSMLFLGYLIFPLKKSHTRRENYIPVYDLVFAVVSAFSFYYFAICREALIARASDINTLDIVVGAIAFLLACEFCRRAVGVPILCVAGAFLAYILYYYLIVRRFTFAMTVRSIIYAFNYDIGRGFYGTPISVCVSFIAVFIILGAFLEKTGIGAFFVNLANSVAGKSDGGPAKVAVIASAFAGMYSGSSVANTVGSGTITIPLMKKTGYRPELAAAVEAAASTGGQIMPPIMGAAAFLMAEMAGLPYSQIVIAAILPAVLYFAGIFLMVHLEAKRTGLKGLPKESIPKFFKLLLSDGYLITPVVILVLCMNKYSAGTAASIAVMSSMIFGLIDKVAVVGIFKKSARTGSLGMSILRGFGFPLLLVGAFFGTLALTQITTAIFVTMVLAFVVTFFVKDAPLSTSKYLDGLESGAKSTIGVGIACAIAGLISAVVSATGLGADLLSIIVPIADKSKILALFLTMLCCIVLGMGVPTTANYVIMASITAPILIKMGIPVLAAHMFVFYFGIVADITPPVALAAYAGSAIAKSDPLKTGVTATRLAIAAFIIPYIFVLNPAMLFIDTTWYDVILIVVTSLVGMYGVASGMEGYSLTPMIWPFRILSIAAGLLLIYPGLVTDLIGLAVLGGITFLQIIEKRKKQRTA